MFYWFCRNFGGRYQNPTLKQISKTKKLLEVKVQKNKAELKTNETLITQVTNALFYKAYKNKLFIL